MNKYEKAQRFADKSTKVAHETIERGIRSAKEATNDIKLSFFSSFASIREFNAKLIDIAHADVDQAFDLAHEIAGVQTPSDFMSIWSNHTKRQFEMMAKQAKEFTEVGQKLASRNTGPL